MIPRWICQLLARFNIHPKGCPGKSSIGADKATVKLKQKDHPL